MDSDLHARIKELRDDLSKLQKQRGKAIRQRDELLTVIDMLNGTDLCERKCEKRADKIRREINNAN